jgi:hypothetical protein
LKKIQRKTVHIGTALETPEEVELLKKYLAENFIIKVNGQENQLFFKRNCRRGCTCLLQKSVDVLKSIQ